MDDKESDLLISVQEQLFTIGSYLATGNNKKMMIHFQLCLLMLQSKT